MKVHFFHRSISNTIVQFLDVFNNIQIARYNSAGTITGYHDVPIKFMPKQKAYNWIHDRKEDKYYPMISVYSTGLVFDNTRQTNRFIQHTLSENISGASREWFRTPIPYNMNLEMTIIAQHIIDMDQILEQILPFFAPQATLRVTYSNLETSNDVKFILESVSPDTEIQIAEDDDRNIAWTLSFNVHAWMYPPIKDSGLIKKIIMKYYTGQDAWDDYQGTESQFTSGAGYENIADYFVGTEIDDDGVKLYNYTRFDE